MKLRRGSYNPLAEILSKKAHRLPQWIGIIITSRPEKDVTTPFQNLSPSILKADNKQNLNDIRKYLRCELAAKLNGRPDAIGVVEKILQKSEGVFLYIVNICNEIHTDRLSIDNIDIFPHGLGSIFFDFFTRQFPRIKDQKDTIGFDIVDYRQRCRPFLELLIAAQEPFQLNFISNILQLTPYEIADIVDSFGSLLNLNNNHIRLSHKSLIDWLSDKQKAEHYWIEAIAGHKRLAKQGMNEFIRGVDEMSEYFRQHLPMHLAQANDWDKLLKLINSKELRLIERWTSKGYPHEGLICLQGIITYLVNQNKNGTLLAGLYTQIAGIHSSLGNYSEAKQNLLNAQKSSDNPRISSIALHDLGSLCTYRGDLSNAEKAYKKALNICLSNTPIIADEAAANLLGIASIKLHSYKYADVYKLAFDALQKAKDAGDIAHTIYANRIIATAYKDNLQFDKSEKHIEAANLLAKFSDLPLEQIALFHLQAWIHYIRSILNNDFCLALPAEIFMKTFEEAKKYSYIPYMISAKLGLAWCALAKFNTRRAQDLIIEVEQMVTSESSHDLIIGKFLTKAAILHQHKNFQKANIQYKKIIGLCQKYLQKSREADAWQGIGATFFHMGEIDKAESCWVKALSTAENCCPTRLKTTEVAIKRSRVNSISTPL